jgi:hypothetical protein
MPHGRRSPAAEQVIDKNQGHENYIVDPCHLGDVEQVLDQKLGQEDDLIDPCHLGENHQLLHKFQTRRRGRKMILLISTVWEPFKKSSFWNLSASPISPFSLNQKTYTYTYKTYRNRFLIS